MENLNGIPAIIATIAPDVAQIKPMINVVISANGQVYGKNDGGRCYQYDGYD